MRSTFGGFCYGVYHVRFPAQSKGVKKQPCSNGVYGMIPSARLFLQYYLRLCSSSNKYQDQQGGNILDEDIMYILPLVGHAGVLFGFAFLTLAIGE